VFVAMTLFGLPMRGSWPLLFVALSLFLIGALGLRPDDVATHRRFTK